MRRGHAPARLPDAAQRAQATAILREQLREAHGRADISFVLEQRYLQIIKALVLRAPGAVVSLTDADLIHVADFRLGFHPTDDGGGVRMTVRQGTGGSAEAFPNADERLAERGKLQ